jgi:hypothetical protein
MEAVGLFCYSVLTVWPLASPSEGPPGERELAAAVSDELVLRVMWHLFHHVWLLGTELLSLTPSQGESKRLHLF